MLACVQRRSYMSVARPTYCAFMSVTSHGESVPMKWEARNKSHQRAIPIENAPDLETWRKQMEAKGTPDQYAMLSAAERNAWVDDHDNRHFNPTMTTPMGFQYGPSLPYNGAYGRYSARRPDGEPWPRAVGLGFDLSARTLLTCHPEVVKRESIGLIWVLFFALLNNYLWAERDRNAKFVKQYYMSRPSQDYNKGVTFGKQVSGAE